MMEMKHPTARGAMQGNTIKPTPVFKILVEVSVTSVTSGCALD